MPVARVDSDQCTSRTLRRRTQFLSECRDSVGGSGSQVLVRHEIRRLGKEEREKLLRDAGLTVEIGCKKGLAMKADLALPWSKLREIRRYNIQVANCIKYLHVNVHRWLKESGVILAGEKKQRALASTLLGDNLEAEAAPMSFPLKGGGEEIRAVPLAYVPQLRAKVLHMLQQNVDRYTCT